MTETSSDRNKKITPTETPQSSESSTTQSWSHIQNDLQSALSSWSDLTQKLANRVSPEEEQLQEVRRILSDLKGKLTEFDK